MMKVLLAQDISDAGKNFLTQKGYEIIKGKGIAPEQLLLDVADCDAILLRTAVITREIMQAAKKLKIVAKHGVGVDNVDLEAASQLGIWVTNTPLANSASVAEHAIMLILECARNAYAIEKAFRGTEKDFDVRNRYISMELEEKTLGIIGLGRIGRMLAKKAAGGLGMKVVGYDPYLPKEADIPGIERMDSADEVLQKADFVSLHIPATQDTKGSFNIDKFKKMKKEAFFINASRGEVVCEEDLVIALQQNMIKGAALDVFLKEPPSKDNPLLSMDNVIASPHNAALTKEALDRMGLHAAICIDEVLSGKAPSWPVIQLETPKVTRQ